MECFPKEVNVLIISYLDKFPELLNVIDTFNLKLENTDYITLFRLNTILYKPELNKYNAMRVYYGFLILKEIHKNIPILEYTNNIINVKHYQLYRMYPPDILYVYEFYKYIFLEDINKVYISPDVLIEMDDLEVTKKLIDSWDEEEEGRALLYSFINFNSIKSVEYILTHEVYDLEFLSRNIIWAYEGDEITPEMNRIILDNFKYIDNFTEENLIDILCTIHTDNVKYIPNFIEKLPDYLSAKSIGKIIINMNQKVIIDHTVMKYFIEKYNILNDIHFDTFFIYYQTVLTETVNYGSSSLKLVVYLSGLDQIKNYVNNLK
jgi:hypothetical protein